MPRLDIAVSAFNDLARFLEQLAGMGNRLRGTPLDLLGSPTAVVQILVEVMRRQKRFVLRHHTRLDAFYGLMCSQDSVCRNLS